MNAVAKKRKAVSGAKGGQSKPKQPSIASNSVPSLATARLVYIWSRGPIVGPVDGLRSVRLDGTPIQAQDGTINYPGVKWQFRSGDLYQERLAGVTESSNEILVNKFGSLASSAAINALAAVTGVADRIAYFTAADTMAVTAFTSAARSLLAAASQAAQRDALGLGATASLSIGAIEITAPIPFIDFHFNNTSTDYDVRLINSASGTLNAVVATGNEFRINGSTAWNDAIAAAKLAAIGVGGIGSYAFCLTNTALTPGATTVGGNLQYAFAVGQGSSSPTGTWRCMGDTVAGGRTLFQRVS